MIHRPKLMTVCSCNPKGVTKAEIFCVGTDKGTCQRSFTKSNLFTTLAELTPVHHPRKGISLCHLPVVCRETWWSVQLTIQQAGETQLEDYGTLSLKFNTRWNSNSGTFLLSTGQQKPLINCRAFIPIRNMFMTIFLCWHVTKGWIWTGKRAETWSILDA